jgi:UDP-N-acetylglucosamine diphosphorylase / glucose-1-phosphate thymidylyltransferase / UDP-N-acetylgalactosamine diphosphorylase / glucosamine-1-phosphate N-acetyltransferase / galactosamine-1-phosphate N-acetyltransferase
MPVVILAAGQGQRLRPLTHDRPKSMLSVAGRPLIHQLLETVAALGLKDVILVVGHGKERLQSYVGDGTSLGLDVKYVEQPLQLGPGHALHQARQHLGKDRFLLLPADSWYHPRLLERLRDAPGPTLLTVPSARSARHGLPTVRAGKAVDLVEVHGEVDGRPSGGAYQLPARLMDLLQPAAFSLRDAIRRDLGETGPWGLVQAHPGEYVDVIEGQDLLSLHEQLMADLPHDVQGTVEPGVQLRGPVRLGEGSIVRAGTVIQGPVHIGRNCEVGPLAVLQPGTCLRNHVRVEPFTVLSNCIIASNVAVASHCRIHDAVVDNGVVVGTGSRITGEPEIFVGSDAVLEPNTTIQAGGRIGRFARVSSGRVVKDIPDHGGAV